MAGLPDLLSLLGAGRRTPSILRNDSAPMIVSHSLHPNALKTANEIGGIPMPSIAVSRMDNQPTGFGDVSLYLNPDKIAPRRGVTAWPTDAFTGRQPRPISDFADQDAWRSAFKADPRFGHMSSSFVNEHDMQSLDEMMRVAEYGAATKVDDPKDFKNLRDYFNVVMRKAGPELYDRTVLDAFGGLEQFGGLTKRIAPEDWGTGRMMPYTIDRAYNRMNKSKAFEAGTENRYMSKGGLRAVLSDTFNDLDDIQRSRGLLTSPSGKDADLLSNKISQWNEAVGDVYSELDPYIKGNPLDILADVARGRNVDYADMNNPTLKYVDREINKLKKQASGMPTAYFEVKPRSVAQIGDFDAAVVPENDKASLEILDRAGVKNIQIYSNADGNSRQDVVSKLRDLGFVIPAGIGLGVAASGSKAQASDIQVGPDGSLYQNGKEIIPPRPSIRSRKPSFSEDLRELFIEKFGMPRDTAERIFGGKIYPRGDKLMQIAGSQGLANVSPYISAPMMLGQAAYDVNSGDYGDAALNLGFGALELEALRKLGAFRNKR